MRKTRVKSQPKFKLRFETREIPKLARKYKSEDDKKALRSGKKIAGGKYSKEHLMIIFEWKTRGRGRTRITKNTDKEISDALRLACAAETERSAIAVLCGLNGVDIPVASSILTCINPKQFTIIDFRALESLSIKRGSKSLDFYLKYLNYCRELARSQSISLRTLDRALWQWSADQQL